MSGTDQTCAHCGETFYSRSKTRRYCCHSCAQAGDQPAVVPEPAKPSYYERNREVVKAKFRTRYRYDPTFKPRVLARCTARRLHPVAQPCEQCGNPKTDRHHDDYSKPEAIRWLCRSCHVKHHIALRQAGIDPDLPRTRKKTKRPA